VVGHTTIIDEGSQYLLWISLRSCWDLRLSFMLHGHDHTNIDTSHTTHQHVKNS